MADNQSQATDQSNQVAPSDQQVSPPEASQSASLDQPAVQPEQPQSQPQPQAPEPLSSTDAPPPPQEEIWPNSTILAIPSLRPPFNGSFSVSFAFGDQPTDEAIKQKFSEWGIVGHHGIDFSLSEGTEVVAVSDGKVIQAGNNGDFGISVMIQHPWGISLYAHLKETKVSKDQEIKAGDVIGLSGQTGAAFGPHLHFGIKQNNPSKQRLSWIYRSLTVFTNGNNSKRRTTIARTTTIYSIFSNSPDRTEFPTTRSSKTRRKHPITIPSTKSISTANHRESHRKNR